MKLTQLKHAEKYMVFRVCLS